VRRGAGIARKDDLGFRVGAEGPDGSVVGRVVVPAKFVRAEIRNPASATGGVPSQKA
jgi:hypothetical protein